jgi:hypothetical protein
MPDVLYAILQNGIILVFAVVVGWLMIKNVRWQTESEDTTRDDKLTQPYRVAQSQHSGGHDASHVHGPGCGHEPVPHGNHVDYLVDGHLHHSHGDHCDDHGPLLKAP